MLWFWTWWWRSSASFPVHDDSWWICGMLVVGSFLYPLLPTFSNPSILQSPISNASLDFGFSNSPTIPPNCPKFVQSPIFLHPQVLVQNACRGGDSKQGDDLQSFYNEIGRFSSDLNKRKLNPSSLQIPKCGDISQLPLTFQCTGPQSFWLDGYGCSRNSTCWVEGVLKKFDVARAMLEKTKAKRNAKKKKPATPDPVNQNTKLTAFLLTAFLLSPFCVSTYPFSSA